MTQRGPFQREHSVILWTPCCSVLRFHYRFVLGKQKSCKVSRDLTAYPYGWHRAVVSSALRGKQFVILGKKCACVLYPLLLIQKRWFEREVFCRYPENTFCRCIKYISEVKRVNLFVFLKHIMWLLFKFLYWIFLLCTTPSTVTRPGALDSCERSEIEHMFSIFHICKASKFRALLCTCVHDIQCIKTMHLPLHHEKDKSDREVAA